VGFFSLWGRNKSSKTEFILGVLGCWDVRCLSALFVVSLFHPIPGSFAGHHLVLMNGLGLFIYAAGIIGSVFYAAAHTGDAASSGCLPFCW